MMNAAIKIDGTKEIIKVLMARDGITRQEAFELVRDCKQEMYHAMELGEDVEEVFSEWTGLEPDYMFDML